MREIKVRGYAVEEMIDSQWIYGTGVHKNTFTDEYAKETGKKYEYFIWTKTGWVEVLGESIGQVTGVTDIEDKPIFEGDVVTNELYKTENVAFKCYFDEKEGMFKLRPFIFKNNGRKIGNKDLTLQMSSVRDKEIIGNKFENPELLEQHHD